MSSQWENFTDITRLILAVSGDSDAFSAAFGKTDFDFWMPFENDNRKVKVHIVTGQVPFSDLTDRHRDRINLPNSVPRFFARIYNLAGKDSFEMVRHLTSFNVFVRHYTQKGF